MSVFTFQPFLNYLENNLRSRLFVKKRSHLRLYCKNLKCPRDLLRRWFVSICSIIESSDQEYELLLQNFQDILRFRVAANQCVSIEIFGVDSQQFGNCELPIIIGTSLWQAVSELSVGSIIDVELFTTWRKDESKVLDISCPFCCFESYLPIGLFILNSKLTCLPILSALDSRRIHVNPKSNLLTVYKNKTKLDESSDPDLFASLSTLKTEIQQWRDEFGNQAFYLPAQIFCKVTEIGLRDCIALLSKMYERQTTSTSKQIIFQKRCCKAVSMQELVRNWKTSDAFHNCNGDLLNETNELNDDFQVNSSVNQQTQKSVLSENEEKFDHGVLCQTCRRTPRTVSKEDLVIIKKTLSSLQKDFSKGNITSAISQSGNFKFSITQSAGLINSDFGDGSGAFKSDVETARGFTKFPSRYTFPPPNNPISVVSATLSLVKLVSSNVRSHFHQSLVTSCLAYVCKISTSDNKNAGTHLEILPGVTFSNKTSCISVASIRKLMLNAANEPKLSRTNKIDNASFFMHSHCFQLRNLPQLPKLFAFLRKKFGLHLDVFFSKLQNKGVLHSASSMPLCERFKLSPMTRQWLLREYPEKWHSRLSPELDGNVPLFGVTAHIQRFPGYSAVPKTIAGNFGARHSVGFLHKCAVQRHVKCPNNALLYAQSDLSGYLTHPTQLAVVCFASLSANGVEDGVIVNKAARDRGFGMTVEEQAPSIRVTTCGKEFSLSLPYRDTKNKFTFSASTSEQCIEVNEPIENGSTLCDLLGIESVDSFCHFIQTAQTSSACRLLLDNPYEIREDGVKTQLKKIFVQCRSDGLFVTIVLETIKLLQKGDKFSTTDGQKTTVTDICQPEDMFFTSSERLPHSPDVVFNISSLRRQTLGLNIGGIVNMLAVIEPQNVNVGLFAGDNGVRHFPLLPQLLDKAESYDFVAASPLFDGITGEMLCDDSGNPVVGDFYIVPLLRYQQQGSKVAYFTGKNVQRSRCGDFLVRSKGKLGGLKLGQQDTLNLITNGSSPALFRQLLSNSEPRTSSNEHSGRISQSACNALRTMEMHDFSVSLE